MTEEPKNSQAVTLGDGRRLAYHEYGAPHGQPLIYNHGYPGSGREAALLDDAAAACGLRIIAPDRPGYGASDAHQGRSLISWADDIAALADQLDLQRFGLIGVSGGGPYALSVLKAHHARVDRGILVCPLGPIYKPELLRAMTAAARMAFETRRFAPAPAIDFFGGLTGGLLSSFRIGIDLFRNTVASAADRKVLAEPLVREHLNDAIEDAMRLGARGCLDDLRLYPEPWGFEPESIDQPVEIWHGDEDELVPLDHAAWYSLHLSHSRLHVVKGEGHFSLPIHHAGEILRGREG